MALTLPSACPPLTGALAALVLALPTPAQWDATAHWAGQPVIDEAFLLLHENAGGLMAFSAAAARWSQIGAPGTQVLGTGDWTALIDDGGQVRAYSARRNQSAPLPQPGLQYTTALVDDDVALLIEVTDPSAPIAWAYSAQTNSWDSIGLGGEPLGADLAISRFVIGLQDELGYWGFAARTGRWVPFTGGAVGQLPVALGNVLLADQNTFGPGGLRKVAAFSGVRGTWDLSPEYTVTSPIAHGHNVAGLVSADAGSTLLAGYSAYTAQWITSSQTVSSDVQLSAGDNWLLGRSSSSSPRYLALGATPGLAWVEVGGSWTTLVGGSDYVLIEKSTQDEVRAFSGLAGGGWVPLSLTSSPTIYPQAGRHALLREGVSLYHAFAPGHAAWASQDSTEPLAPQVGDSVSGYFSKTVPLTGYSTRWNRWIAGPANTASSNLVFAQGSILGAQELSGATADRIELWDERCETWLTLDPGYRATLEVSANVLVAWPPAALGSGPFEVQAYSVQRGDWSSPPPGALTLPVATSPAPAAEDNLAWLVDGAGQLWAFGAPAAGHLWFPWPNGTEFNVSGLGSDGAAPQLGYSVRAEPGQLLFGFVDPFQTCPGLSIAGIGGLLYLDPLHLFHLGLLGVPDDTRVVIQTIPLPNPLPRGVQAWWQPYVIDLVSLSGSFADRADSSWLF